MATQQTRDEIVKWAVEQRDKATAKKRATSDPQIKKYLDGKVTAFNEVAQFLLGAP